MGKAGKGMGHGVRCAIARVDSISFYSISSSPGNNRTSGEFSVQVGIIVFSLKETKRAISVSEKGQAAVFDLYLISRSVQLSSSM